MSSEYNKLLLPGEWVRIKNPDEILATLDRNGMYEGLPFMPEMLAFCGQRFKVRMRAHKGCDTIGQLRSMKYAVYLDMPRCNGSAHGDCAQCCHFYWKETWIDRVPHDNNKTNAPPDTKNVLWKEKKRGEIKKLSLDSRTQSFLNSKTEFLWENTHRYDEDRKSVLYRCQATEFFKITTHLPWYEPRQYIIDIIHNGFSVVDVVRGLAISTYNKIILKFNGRKYKCPRLTGTLQRTPRQDIGLQPGDLVEVKTREEILATLDTEGKNRGMVFDPEMLPYCGQRFRVFRIVKRIIDEESGRLIEFKNRSVILDGAFSKGIYHRCCPRSHCDYWREIWLKLIEKNQIK